MAHCNEYRNFCLGALINPPTFAVVTPNINWGMSAIGKFFAPNPPHLQLVQGLVKSQWYKRGSIEVQRIGDFFIFSCSQREDLQALIQQFSAIIDGRIITFRRCHWSVVTTSSH